MTERPTFMVGKQYVYIYVHHAWISKSNSRDVHWKKWYLILIFSKPSPRKVCCKLQMQKRTRWHLEEFLRIRYYPPSCRNLTWTQSPTPWISPLPKSTKKKFLKRNNPLFWAWKLHIRTWKFQYPCLNKSHHHTIRFEFSCKQLGGASVPRDRPPRTWLNWAWQPLERVCRGKQIKWYFHDCSFLDVFDMTVEEPG